MVNRVDISHRQIEMIGNASDGGGNQFNERQVLSGDARFVHGRKPPHDVCRHASIPVLRRQSTLSELRVSLIYLVSSRVVRTT